MIHECGADIIPGNKFCTSCGKPVIIGNENKRDATGSPEPIKEIIKEKSLDPNSDYAGKEEIPLQTDGNMKHVSKPETTQTMLVEENEPQSYIQEQVSSPAGQTTQYRGWFSFPMIALGAFLAPFGQNIYHP